jgi:hypothetical protein
MFLQLKVPQTCSWCWRKILKLRDIAKKFLRFMVGDGNRIYRLVAPGGILYEKYGYRVIYDALDAKLSSVMNGKD